MKISFWVSMAALPLIPACAIAQETADVNSSYLNLRTGTRILVWSSSLLGKQASVVAVEDSTLTAALPINNRQVVIPVESIDSLFRRVGSGRRASIGAGVGAITLGLFSYWFSSALCGGGCDENYYAIGAAGAATGALLGGSVALVIDEARPKWKRVEPF